MRRKPLKQGKGFQCPPAQREKCAGQPCIVCANETAWNQVPVDPAHVIPRSMARDDEGDPLRVVPLCRWCHTAYDQGQLDLLPYLEPRFRDELAEAVRCVGLIAALERVSNERWRPVVDRVA